MTLGKWIQGAEEALCASSCPDSALDAKLLAAGVLNLPFGNLRFYAERELSDAEENEMNARLARRVSKEPLQYIENAAYFMGLCFYVDERVLIPRQDTETLCEAALDKIRHIKNPKILDMCTGSGALAVSLAHFRKDASVTAADISRDAIDVAEKNARILNARVRFVESDLFSALGNEAFDLIVCNPPYLTEDDMNELQDEVKREPALALFGGADGLLFYRRLAEGIKKHLAPGGYALFEVGMGQARDVLEIMKTADMEEFGTIKDLCGVERVVFIRRKEQSIWKTD